MATIQLHARESMDHLRRALKESGDADQKNRIRAIISIKQGVTKTATAKRFVISRTSLISWVGAYNEGGVSALIMSKGGRPEGNQIWAAKIFEDLAKEIDKGGYWSIPRMQEWIKERHKKEIPEQTVWYRMDKLNYSYKGARPHPVQGDREKQETFKKGACLPSWSR